MTETFSPFIDQQLAEAAVILKPWFGIQRLRDTFLCELHQNVADAMRLELSSSLSEVADGQRFMLELDDSRCVVAQVHAQSDNEPIAHLMILHSSFPLHDATGHSYIKSILKTHFANKSINRACFFRHGEPLQTNPPLRVRSYYVAAPIQQIAQGRLPALPVHLVEPKTLDFFESYSSWYEEFWRLRPALKPLVRVEPIDDLAMCMDDGGVRLLMKDETPCGLVAAQRRNEFGLSGWRLREKVIAPSHWGQGLSVAANILAARDLPSEPGDAMWGTISPRNEASLRSALRVGRRVVGCTYWLDFPML